MFLLHAPIATAFSYSPSSRTCAMSHAPICSQYVSVLFSRAGEMLSRMLGHSCLLLQSLGDFVEHPDLADDSFLLAGRALHYCPRLILPQPLLPALLDSAAAGLLVQHRCAGCLSRATGLAVLSECCAMLCCTSTVLCCRVHGDCYEANEASSLQGGVHVSTPLPRPSDGAANHPLRR